jgi:hypothetical protein
MSVYCQHDFACEPGTVITLGKHEHGRKSQRQIQCGEESKKMIPLNYIPFLNQYPLFIHSQLMHPNNHQPKHHYSLFDKRDFVKKRPQGANFF